MTYKVTIKQTLIVTAPNSDVAKKLAKDNPPYVSIGGAGSIYGIQSTESYSVQSTPEIEIISVQQSNKAGKIR